MTIQYAGIDFGTSNSTLGVIQEGKPVLLPLEGSHTDIPTALFFNFEEQTVSYGRQAKAEYIRGDEGRLMQSLKSVLGSSLVEERTAILGGRVAFKSIIGMFLKHLKQKLDTQSEAYVESVVLGRPVRFVDEDDAADKAAQTTLEDMARVQGFKNISFQFEPIAAALSYEQDVTKEELVLVVDIGGGTSDFSVVRVSPEGRSKADRKDDILANTGVHIGGTDFDRVLSMAQVMPAMGYGSMTKDGKRPLPSKYYFELATWHRINYLYDPKILSELVQVRRDAMLPDAVEMLSSVIRERQGHALATYVEQAKIHLSAQETAGIQLHLEEETLKVQASVFAFNEAIFRQLEKLKQTINDALTQAGVKAEEIDTIFLTGGSTRVPALQLAVREIFPSQPFVVGDTFGSVGLGLALDASRKFQ